ncbi:MAG: ACT domain-containing protein [Ignisphaera sp.]
MVREAMLHSDLDRASDESLAVITVIGADKPGIVAGITSVLAKYNVNIVDISQTVVRGIFSMIMIVDLSTGRIDLPKLREELIAKGRDLGVEVSVNHIAVFRAMQRV